MLPGQSLDIPKFWRLTRDRVEFQDTVVINLDNLTLARAFENHNGVKMVELSFVRGDILCPVAGNEDFVAALFPQSDEAV